MKIAENIYKIIQELQANNSSNYKIEVLKKYSEDIELWKYLKYVYNPRFKYFIKCLGSDFGNKITLEADYSMQNLYETLDSLRKREVTGNAGIDLLRTFMEHATLELSTLMIYALSRDIESNVSIKTFNKVKPDFIPQVPYMRCSKLDEKSISHFEKESSFLAQFKADGVFSYIIKDGMSISMVTRNGTDWWSDKIVEELKNLPDCVLVGEAMIMGENGIELDRKTGNGLINKFIKGESTLKSIDTKLEGKLSDKQRQKLHQEYQDLNDELLYIEERLHFKIWDGISVQEFEEGYSDTIYECRLLWTKAIIKDIPSLHIIETKEVTSIEEAQEIASEYIANGYEGAIIKKKDSIFENKTSKDLVKLKAIEDADLLCVGYETGNGKYEGMIGALMLESSDGKLKVNVGSGLTDADRKKDPEEFINKIIEIQFNEVIQSKGKDTMSLFLPRFVSVRFDKDVADSLERILV